MHAAGSIPPRRVAGRYLLTDQLGSGAMGTVWSGYDEVLRRRVAVKELAVPPGVPSTGVASTGVASAADVADLRERMLREARALGGLSHPNVITVYDVVQQAGEPFVVLELFPSQSLAALLAARGPLDQAEAATVGAAVASALTAAHAAGITHRDVKPGNVLIAADGRIKLTDFGIARNSADVTITLTGLVLGSPAFMAPEVAAGGAVTPAADLWGLGATLFAAVEGRPPYNVRGEAVATITEVVDGPVPRPAMPGPVSELIVALMNKDPACRLPLSDVGQALHALLTDPEDPLFPDRLTPPAARPVPIPLQRALGQRVSALSAGAAAGAAGTPVGPAGTSARPAGAAGTSAGPTSTLAGTPDSPAPTVGAPAQGTPLARDPGPLPRPAPAPAPPAELPQQQGARRLVSTPPSDPRLRRPPEPAWLLDLAEPVANRKRALLAMPLVMVGALAVLLGTIAGWAVTRVLADQSPLTTTLATALDPNGELVTHTDPAGFSVGVPAGWALPQPAATAGDPVRFLSPDQAYELRVERVAGSRGKPVEPAAVVTDLTARQLGVEQFAVDEPPRPVVAGASRAGSPQQLRYRTVTGGIARLTWTLLVPRGTEIWVVRLSAPADRTAGAAELFGRIEGRFAPE